jgi:hypothetical protein
MRPEPDAKTPLKRRPPPVAAWCVECPVGLILKSTRSNANEDARRDFDDFDINEELCRARRALCEVSKGEDAERSPDALYSFAAECFLNIDEWLSRGGELPSAWRDRFQATPANAPDSPNSAREALRKAFLDAKNAMPCACNSGRGT